MPCTWAHLSNRRFACSTSFFVCSQSNKTWRWNFRRTRLSTQDTKSITEHNKQKGHWNLPVLKSMAEAKCELAVSSANLGERSRKHRFGFRESPKLPVQMLHLLYVQRTPWLQLQNLQMAGRHETSEIWWTLMDYGLQFVQNSSKFTDVTETQWISVAQRPEFIWDLLRTSKEDRAERMRAASNVSSASVLRKAGLDSFCGVPKDWHLKFMEIP